MKKKIYGLLFAAFSLATYQSFGQTFQNLPTIHHNEEGRFMKQYRGMGIPVSDLSNNLNTIFGLNHDYTFILKKQSISKVTGIEHFRYQQYYKGYPVLKAEVLVRANQGIVTSVSGIILPAFNHQIDLKVVYDESEIRSKILSEKKLLKVTYSRPAELVIYHNSVNDAQLAYKIRIDGMHHDLKYSFNEYIVNAQTGKIIKVLPKSSHADVEGVGHTYYYGEQTITSDLEGGVHYLRDNERNIVTMNASGKTPDYSPEATLLFPDATHYTNDSENWLQKNNLMTIKLSAAEHPQLISNIGLSFISFRGNRLITTVEKLDGVDYIEIARNEDLALDGSISLPYTLSNLNIILEDGGTYRVNIMKDSCMIDFSSFELVSVLTDETSKVQFMMTETSVGTHDWVDGGSNGNYVIDFVSNPAIDAHWGIEMAHDFYKENFGRISFDGEGTLVTNYYNGTAMVAGTQNNAAAMNDPYNAMVYGTGEDGFNPFVVMDVTGHEYSHLVIGASSNLNYSGESGALNESFADMMGISIENFAFGSLDEWFMGDGLHPEIPFIRNMANPNDEGMSGVRQPDTYLGEYWAPTGEDDPDNGGVHINSGVGNYWFYLLCVGGEGVNDNGNPYSITPIGIEKAQKIAYEAFTEHLTSYANYYDAYEATLEVAAEIYGETSVEYTTTKDAWAAVGIPYPGGVTKNPDFTSTIHVYPNPSNGILHINVLDGHLYRVNVYNILGQIVYNSNISVGLNTISLEHLTNGVYNIVFSTEAGESTQKITLVK